MKRFVPILLCLGLLSSCSNSGSSSFTSQTLPVFDGPVDVRSGRDQVFTFSIDTRNMFEIILRGSFAVTTGEEKAIIAFLVDEKGFSDYTSGWGFKPIYRVDDVAEDKVNVPLNRSGIFYFVFLNSSKELDPKTVEGVLNLEYEAMGDFLQPHSTDLL